MESILSHAETAVNNKTTSRGPGRLRPFWRIFLSIHKVNKLFSSIWNLRGVLHDLIDLVVGESSSTGLCCVVAFYCPGRHHTRIQPQPLSPKLDSNRKISSKFTLNLLEISHSQIIPRQDYPDFLVFLFFLILKGCEFFRADFLITLANFRLLNRAYAAHI